MYVHCEKAYACFSKGSENHIVLSTLPSPEKRRKLQYLPYPFISINHAYRRPAFH